jgi:flagellar protein FliO/FliZ
MSNNYELIMAALRMFLSLILVAGVLIIIFYFIKKLLKKDNGITSANHIKVIANHYIGLKKNISLIEVPGSILVLGITSDTISFLSKIEDKEIIDRIKNSDEKLISLPFSEQLKKITTKFKLHNH